MLETVDSRCRVRRGRILCSGGCNKILKNTEQILVYCTKPRQPARNISERACPIWGQENICYQRTHRSLHKHRLSGTKTTDALDGVVFESCVEKVFRDHTTKQPNQTRTEEQAHVTGVSAGPEGLSFSFSSSMYGAYRTIWGKIQGRITTGVLRSTTYCWRIHLADLNEGEYEPRRSFCRCHDGRISYVRWIFPFIDLLTDSAVQLSVISQ